MVYKSGVKLLTNNNNNNNNKIKNRRKRLITVIVICGILLILFALNCFLYNFLNYRKWSPFTTEYSLYSSPTKAILSNDISHQQTVSHNLFTNNLVDNNNNNNNTKNKQKIILLWTTFFGQTNYVQSLYESSNCLTKKNCLFTSNRSYLVDSDAVIFHLRDLDLKDWPPIRTPNQRYILLNQESPANTPKILHKIEGLINWTATYRYGSDIFLNPIFRHRSEPNPSYRGDANYAQNKSRMIVWMASNCRTDSNREMYVEELKKTVPVDVYGKCGDKVCLPKMSPKCLDQISRKYRFILAFENSICRDYITEKYFDTLHYDIIPIVFGGSDYRSIAPQKTSIDALSYSSPRHLARYLLYLSKNPKQYNEYFKWKRDYELTGQHYSCQICQKLNDPTEPVKVWDNLEHWWFTEAECRKWSPTKNFR